MFFQHHKPELFYRLSTIFTLIAGAIFLISSAGWIFNVSPLFYVDSGWSPIKPACSISGLMLAFSNLLIVRRRSLNWFNYFLAIVPLLLATISIIENLSDASTAFGDQFLQPNVLFPLVAHPGRISFSSGVLVLLTSIGLLFGLNSKKNVKRSQYAAMLVIYLCLFLLLGHLMGSREMSSSDGIFHGSIHSLFGLLLLNLAILSRTPEFGIVHFYRQNSLAARVHFRLFIQTVVLLFIIGWLRFKGEEIGLYDARLGIPIMIILSVGVLLIVISRSAASLVKMEQKNLQLVNLLQSQKSELESILSRTNDGVYTLDKNLRITSANAKALESVSKSASEVLGRHVTTVFVDPQLAQFYQSSLEKAFATQENSEVVVHSKMLNRWFFNNIFPNEHGITTFYKEITAQKLAEIELNKAKEHFRTLVENLKDIVIRVDVEGRVSYISPGNADHSESIKNQLADWFTKYLHERKTSASEMFQYGSSENKYEEVECAVFEGDRSEVFELRYTAEFNIDGKITSFLAICRNITEQARIREERQRLNSILHHMTAMVAQANENLVCTYLNPAGLEMLEIDASTPLPPEHLFQYTTPENAVYLKETAFPTALEQGTWMGESVLVSRTGKITPVMMILIVHRDKESKFSYLSLVAYDLSEIKSTETALRESEKRWQFAVDGSNLGLWDWNINSNQTFYSNRWKSMLGHEEHEISNQPMEFETRLHPEDRVRVMQELNDYFGGRSTGYDSFLRLRKKDGSYIHVRDRGMITDFNADGSPSRMIGTHSDVTHEHNQAEMLRRSKQELRSLASHLQNLREEERLNVSRMMQEDVGQQLSSVKMTFSSLNTTKTLQAADVKDRVKKAQSTLENAIMVLQQISTELRPTIIEDLGLVASLQALTTEFRSRFNIRIRFSSLLDNLETSSKVALCIYRVYQEALSNIAHHSKASMVAVRLTLSEDGRLLLAIKDNGVGFDVTDKEFQQNFGLVEVRERMLMIDGDMEIRTTPGSGTVLTVSAPMTQ